MPDATKDVPDHATPADDEDDLLRPSERITPVNDLPPPTLDETLDRPTPVNDLPRALPVETRAPAPPAEALAPAPTVRIDSTIKTMVGVAIPGVAPLPAKPAKAPARVELPSKERTMIGISLADLADLEAARARQSSNSAVTPPPPPPMPIVPTPPPPMPIVPAPPPLMPTPLPEAPRLPDKRGMSAVAVVVLVIILVAAGALGAYAYYTHRDMTNPITVQHLVNDRGGESLQVHCPSCPNGTIVTLDASSATVEAGEALVPLPSPLSIGDNDLVLKIDRPGIGRDEDVKIHVHIPPSLHTDLTTLASKPPVITIRVEAAVGSSAFVDDKPLALDAQGRGTYEIDLTHETSGPSDDTESFERKIPFSITPADGKTETGELVVRTSIMPLHLDAPGLLLVTNKAAATVSGQTQPNATLTVGGEIVPVDAQGRFTVRVELPAMGETLIEIVASSPPLAPRTASAKVIRTASLEASAKEFNAQNPLGFDAFASDPASKIGQKAVVEGTVVGTRSEDGQTVLLVDEQHACAAAKKARAPDVIVDSQCLVRVVHGEEDRVSRGSKVRVYGEIRGQVTANGRTVPEIDAALLLLLRNEEQ